MHDSDKRRKIKRTAARGLIAIGFVAVLWLMIPLYKFAQWFQQTVLHIDWIIVVPSLRMTCCLLGFLAFSVITYAFKRKVGGDSWRWSWKDSLVFCLYGLFFLFSQMVYYVAVSG